MTLQIYVPFSLSNVQSILAIVLSILGVGWFFFLSAAIRYKASKQIKETGSVPVLNTILPLNILDVYNLLRTKTTTLTVTTCMLMILGLALTNFDSIIVVNTIGYVESCKTDVINTRAFVTVDSFQVAVAAYAETDALVKKRSKSGVPSGVLVGQLPDDPRWVFDEKYDVEPYPWRSSCSIYALGSTNVNMNSSVMYFDSYQGSDLSELLPEVHAKFQFRNSPDGYNFSQRSFRSYVHFNKSNSDTTISTATGSLTLILEDFRRGNTSIVGAGVINRLWTLRVPEEVRMTYHRDNPATTEILSVPMYVKAYTCEVVRVKEGGVGGVNFNGSIDTALNVAGELIGRKYLTAQIKGTDDMIVEYSPEYWASYIEVRDTMVSSETIVLARISLPCISIHPLYILLVCSYSILVIVGFMFWLKIYKHLPNGVVGWASRACKESRLSNIDEAEFRDTSWDIKIFPKPNKEQPKQYSMSLHGQSQSQQNHQNYSNPRIYSNPQNYSNSQIYSNPQNYSNSQIFYTSNKAEAERKSQISQASSQNYYSEVDFGSTLPNS